MNDIVLVPQLATAPPPAATVASSTPPGTSHFDLKGHAERLKSTPKEHYPPPTPEAPPKPEEPPVSDSTASGNATDASDTSDAPKATSEHKRKARHLLNMYEMSVSSVFASIAAHPGYPAKRFNLDADARAQAEESLAEGYAQGDMKFSVPWYLPLLMIAVYHNYTNYTTLRQAMKDKAGASERAPSRSDNAARRDAMRDHATQRTADAPLQPDSITTPTGRTIPLPKAPLPLCQLPGCTNTVRRHGMKYCCQSHSGKATRGTKHPKNNAPPAP